MSYAALSGWYARFAERRANPLYLTGESYAGIYVPKLAQQILARAEPHVLPQFKGFAVGDGCLGTKTGVCGGAAGPWWDVLFLYGHGQISTLLWDELVEQCTVGALKHGGALLRAAACAAALGRVPLEAAGYFAYGLYDDCTYDAGLLRGAPPHSTQPRNPASTAPPGLRARLAAFLPAEAAAALLGDATNDYVCGGGGAQRQWAARPVESAAQMSPCGGLPLACRVSHRGREALGLSCSTHSRRAPLLPTPRRPHTPLPPPCADGRSRAVHEPGPPARRARGAARARLLQLLRWRQRRGHGLPQHRA